MTADPVIDLRIFVVGVPRSGTTLLQSLLAAHSAVASFTESHFFSRHFSFVPLRRGPILSRNPLPRLREFLAENDAAGAGAARWFEARQRLLRMRPVLPLMTRSVANRLVGVLDELAQRRGRATWIEKTPMHLRYVPFLERLSGPEPSTRFVHMVRQGLEVVSSLQLASQGWERSYDLATCARRWNDDVELSLGRMGSRQDHFVLYEELASQPEKTLARLVDELGLEWEPEMLHRYGRASDGLVTDDEPWKAGVGRRIQPSATSERVLTPEQRSQVSRWLRPELYERIADGVSTRAEEVRDVE
jgi:hypothetical protein